MTKVKLARGVFWTAVIVIVVLPALWYKSYNTQSNDFGGFATNWALTQKEKLDNFKLGIYKTQFDIAALIPKDKVALLVARNTFVVLTGRKIVRDFDPRMAEIYALQDVELAWKKLRENGIDYIITTDTPRPTLYNTIIGDLTSSPRWTEKLLDTIDSNLYRIRYEPWPQDLTRVRFIDSVTAPSLSSSLWSVNNPDLLSYDPRYMGLASVGKVVVDSKKTNTIYSGVWSPGIPPSRTGLPISPLKANHAYQLLSTVSGTGQVFIYVYTNNNGSWSPTQIWGGVLVDQARQIGGYFLTGTDATEYRVAITIIGPAEIEVQSVELLEWGQPNDTHDIAEQPIDAARNHATVWAMPTALTGESLWQLHRVPDNEAILSRFSDDNSIDVQISKQNISQWVYSGRGLMADLPSNALDNRFVVPGMSAQKFSINSELSGMGIVGVYIFQPNATNKMVPQYVADILLDVRKTTYIFDLPAEFNIGQEFRIGYLLRYPQPLSKSNASLQIFRTTIGAVNAVVEPLIQQSTTQWFFQFPSADTTSIGWSTYSDGRNVDWRFEMLEKDGAKIVYLEQSDPSRDYWLYTGGVGSPMASPSYGHMFPDETTEITIRATVSGNGAFDLYVLAFDHSGKYSPVHVGKIISDTQKGELSRLVKLPANSKTFRIGFLLRKNVPENRWLKVWSLEVGVDRNGEK